MTDHDLADLADICWRLDAYAGHWLPADELTAVTEWMADNQLVRATTQRPIVVERGTITYGQDNSPATLRGADRDITTQTVPLRTAPPTVWQPACAPAVLAALHRVFTQHEWSSGFGGVCVDCSRTRTGPDGRTWCHRDDAAPWPCRAVQAAMDAAGIPRHHAAARQPTRLLGDCLSPADNAKAFGPAAA